MRNYLSLSTSLRTKADIPEIEILEEFHHRRQARDYLAPFTTYTFPQYIMEPAHELICDALQAVAEGQLDRLMLFAPPQHGKSELVSRRLPPFFLAQNPDLSVVLSFILR